jgi:hypothetical protein
MKTKINAAQRLKASMPVQKWRTKDAYGPKAVSLKRAKALGFTEGPFYHGTDTRSYNNIMTKGFRSKGAAEWEVEDPGTIEEFKKWGTVNPVMFTPDRDGATGFGKKVVTCYVKPGRVRSASGMTLYGGLYVEHPADVIPIKDPVRQEKK